MKVGSRDCDLNVCENATAVSSFDERNGYDVGATSGFSAAIGSTEGCTSTACFAATSRCAKRAMHVIFGDYELITRHDGIIRHYRR